MRVLRSEPSNRLPGALTAGRHWPGPTASCTRPNSALHLLPGYRVPGTFPAYGSSRNVNLKDYYFLFPRRVPGTG